MERKFKHVYKVGDVVVVHKPSGLPGSYLFGEAIVGWTDAMDKYDGIVTTIRSIKPGKSLLLNDCPGYLFLQRWVEVIKEDDEAIDIEDISELFNI